MEGREAGRHHVSDSVGNGFRLRALPHAAVRSRGHRQRQSDSGRVQGESLSAFLGQSAPSPAPLISEAHQRQEEKTSLVFFNLLNFVVQLCPTHPSSGTDDALRESASAPVRRSTAKRFQRRCGRRLKAASPTRGRRSRNTRKRSSTPARASGDGFGTRAHLNGSYIDRMAAAVLGIYVTRRKRRCTPSTSWTKTVGQQTPGNRYALRFPPNQLPPVNAFWSLTLYELPASLLSANPLNRYLINSPTLPTLKQDADGGVTLCVQHESPGHDKVPNWLPAPKGPFFMVLRLYWPKPEALDGRWTAPPLKRL